MIKYKELNRDFLITGCADTEAARENRSGSRNRRKSRSVAGGSVGKLAGMALVMGLSLSVTACGGKEFGDHEKGVANPDTTQTSFAIMGGQSALSPGYTDNVVLNDLQEDTGIKIDWTTMSESLAEQVNIRIAGEELPDAFLGVGFSNYDISRYGDDGTFIDLTPYLTEEYMPNLSRILDEKVAVMRALKEHFIEGVTQIENTKIHGMYDETSAPHIISVGFAGIRSEVLLHALEERGIYVSSGSACSSNHPQVSGVLKGIGASQEYLDATLRFSMSEFTTREEIDYTLETLKEIVPVLRRYTRH